MGRIPERWKEYSGSGKPIKGVPIFAFKTPLAKKYSVQRDAEQEFVEAENEFTPDDLCKFVEGLGYEIAVIIDLTNTFRYYNGVEEFGQAHNIQYEKVKCEGQKLPNEDVMWRVANIMSDVIYRHGKDSKKVVGIHCTHGVNRTGYMVVRYMVEWLGFDPKDAIEAFDEARGHSMEREKYIEDLLVRKPEDRFAQWKKHRIDSESVNGLFGMPLWTGFDEDDNNFQQLPAAPPPPPPAAAAAGAPDDDKKTENKGKQHHFHPYNRNQPPHYRGKWRGGPPFNNGGFNNFYDDDFPGTNKNFSPAVTADNNGPSQPETGTKT